MNFSYCLAKRVHSVAQVILHCSHLDAQMGRLETPRGSERAFTESACGINCHNLVIAMSLAL